MDELKAEDRVILRYVSNPNGSVDDIAGITNEGRNVVGLMPHPERASNDLIGSSDGLPLLRSLLESATRPREPAESRRGLVAASTDSRCLQRRGRHAGFPPSEVGDALPFAIRLG